MRHRVERKRLNRDMDHRKALLMNLSQELIKHEIIETTLVKAKYLRSHVERLITKAKEAFETKDKVRSFNVIKQLRTDMKSEEQIRKLVSEIAPRYAGINGGYTKIVRTRYRDGDKALMARIELTKKETKKETKKDVKEAIKPKVMKEVKKEVKKNEEK
jgi:large subunit ribosomal protein L17